MSLRMRRMFADRVDLMPSSTPTKDASGGRVDVPGTPVADVPCRIEPASMDDLAAARTLDMKMETKVFFDADPGPLPPGSTMKVAKYLGVAPERKPVLTVQRLVRDGIGSLTLWRADCSGRA